MTATPKRPHLDVELQHDELPAKADSLSGLRRTIWDRLLRLVGVRTTWRWCVVGTGGSGRHTWGVFLEKCHNHTPCISGYFLTVIACGSEASARELHKSYQAIADEHNRTHGFWV